MNLKDIRNATLLGILIACIVLFIYPLLQKESTHNFINNELSFASAVRKAAPAVVNIYSLAINKSDPMNFRANNLQGLGSGVIMQSNGYILTNYHVIKKADQIVVALQDGRKFNAILVGSDPETDLAALKIAATDLPVIPVNLNSSTLVGDVVLAIGNPYNLGQTITQGIISATGRSGLGSNYQDFLQTDAAINAGNSGGALINTNGYLVGLNTAAFKVGGDSNGISFAIPVKLASNIMLKLIKNGRVIRGALGVSGEEVDPYIAKILNLPNDYGVFITDVDPNSPAAQVLQPNDVIVKYNNIPVPGVKMLLDSIAETKPNTIVNITIIRAGNELTVPVTILEKISII